MIIEKFNHDIERQTLQPKKKEKDRRKSREEYRKNQLKIQVRKEKKVRGTSMLFATLFFVCGFVILARDNKIYQKQENISVMKNELKILAAENEDMNIKLLENTSLEKIESIAKDKLSMVTPNAQDVVNINK